MAPNIVNQVVCSGGMFLAKDTQRFLFLLRTTCLLCLCILILAEFLKFVMNNTNHLQKSSTINYQKKISYAGYFNEGASK